MTRRLKLLFLMRLIPLAERNYNLVELGPRGTGKSYVVQELSPYAALLTGPTTVANLFGHMNGQAEGHGSDLGRRRLRRSRRPSEDAQGGHHDDEDLLRVGHVPAWPGGGVRRRQHRHVRQHEPADRRDGPDRATCSRRCRTSSATTWRSSTGCTSTSLAGRCRRCGTSSSPTTTDSSSTTWRRRFANSGSTTSPRSSTAQFSLGAHLNARDRKAVRKTVSGLMKIIHPHGELERRMNWPRSLSSRSRDADGSKNSSRRWARSSTTTRHSATRCRRRAKSVSSGCRSKAVGTSSRLIPLAPGSVYAVGVSSDGTVGLFRLEVSVSSGTGKIKMAGGVTGQTKESLLRAFSVHPDPQGRARWSTGIGHLRLPCGGHRSAEQSRRT